MATAEQLEQVKARLRAVADQIRELSKSQVPPDQFWRSFLESLVEALHAYGGVVWVITDGPDGRPGAGIRPQVAAGGEELAKLDEPEVSQLNQKLVTDSLVLEQTAAYHASDEIGLPPELALLVIPVKASGMPVAAVEIIQRGNISKESREGYAQFIERMCAHATNYLERREAGESVLQTHSFWSDFEAALLDMQRYLDVKHVAGVAANDGKKLLEVNRLSVVEKRGKKCVVLATSGVDEVQKRADQTRSLAKLAREAIKLGEPIVFSGTVGEFGRKLNDLVDTHVRLSNARFLMLVPLFANDRKREDLEPSADELRKLKPRKAIGCLIIEQLTDGRPPADLTDRANLLADHTGAALHNARMVRQIPLFGLLRKSGAIGDWLHGRKLVKLLLGTAAVAGVVAALTLIPWDYRVKGEGKLMPTQQYRVFAPMDAEVAEVFVRSGQEVQKGDLLVRLDADELEQRLQQLESEQRNQKSRAASLAAEIEAAKRAREFVQEQRARGQQEEAQEAAKSYEPQIARVREQLAKLEVRAPSDGVVTTFQVDQLLIGRPVGRSDQLMEIMDPSGPWRLEVEVPEHRMGHVFEAQSEAGSIALPVKYVLATAPEETYQGTVSEQSTRSNRSTEGGGAVMEFFVDIDAEDIPARTIGAEATAKIDCGERSLGYVLFGDVVEFLQRHLWY